MTLTQPERLAKAFASYRFPDAVPARFNVAPTTMILVKPNEPSPDVIEMRWGLVSAWASDVKIGARMINARCETVAEKPAFRSALTKRRCLIFADGYYEWAAEDGAKQPYHFRLKSREPFALAGLYETWNRGPEPVQSAVVITTTPNALQSPIHDRMPVILDPREYERWLTPEPLSAAEAVSILVPYPADAMEVARVNRRVNKASYDAPDCLEIASA